MSRRFELAAREALRRRRTDVGELRQMHLAIEEQLINPRDQDFTDRANGVGDSGCFRALCEVEYQELVRIDAALGRIEAGTYGVCRRCGNSIGPRRLETIPATELCIACARWIS